MQTLNECFDNVHEYLGELSLKSNKGKAFIMKNDKDKNIFVFSSRVYLREWNCKKKSYSAGLDESFLYSVLVLSASKKLHLRTYKMALEYLKNYATRITALNQKNVAVDFEVAIAMCFKLHILFLVRIIHITCNLYMAQDSGSRTD